MDKYQGFTYKFIESFSDNRGRYCISAATGTMEKNLAPAIGEY
jgi:hypothetical protein